MEVWDIFISKELLWFIAGMTTEAAFKPLERLLKCITYEPKHKT
jgi:hypothetical protein